MLDKSAENLPAIMQLFNVIIRALHRFGDANDIPVLRSVIEQEKAFMSKVPDNQYLVVKRVMEWADRSVKALKRANSK